LWDTPGDIFVGTISAAKAVKFVHTGGGQENVQTDNELDVDELLGRTVGAIFAPAYDL
jgi:hypothetical protein